MYNRQYTPERITKLKENEIFVFGSNLAGSHGGGAARQAYEHFGAVWGQGVGLQGQSYGIPTMHGGVETIKPYVDEFIKFAKEQKDLIFYVTQIGCGIAGFRVAEIAPLFKNAMQIENIILPEKFVDILTSGDKYNLERFVQAQNYMYKQALEEIEDGYKQSHWIWYIFPQLVSLGHSSNAKYYGISGYDEAEAYLNHPILGTRLREVTNALLSHRGQDVNDIFGGLDAMKVRSCMTLFDAVSPGDIFEKVISVFYNGIYDKRTLDYM